MSQPTFVQDYNAIVDVLNKYNDGGAKADSNIMRPAFSEQAIFGVDGNGQWTVSQQDLPHSHPISRPLHGELASLSVTRNTP